MIAIRKSSRTQPRPPASAASAPKKVGSGSAALVAAMMMVNAVNFGVNIWLASVLSPEAFGDISLMVTLLLVFGVLACVLQLTTSVAVLNPDRDTANDLRAMRLLTNRIGLGGALALAISAPQLTDLLQVGSPWALLVMALGLPVHLQLAVERGRLHGEMSFGRLTGTLLAEGVGRAIATVISVLLLRNLLGLTIALNIGFIAGYLVCRPRLGRWSWCDISSPSDHPPLRSVGVGLIAVTALTNIDLVIAKVAFDPATAGGFAALTLAGRIVFFGSWTIQQAVLPFVSAENPSFSAVLRRRAFMIGNIFLCAVLVAGAWITADVWVAITYGTDFADLAFLVGPYALGAAFVAVAAGSAMLSSVGGNPLPAVCLLAGAIALGTLLFIRAGSLESFVFTRTVVVGVLVLTTWGIAIVGNRATQRNVAQRSGRTRRLVPGGQSA